MEKKENLYGLITYQMTTKEALNAVDTEIASIQLSTSKISKLTNDPEEKLMALSREIAYQECRNIILKVTGGVDND